MTIEMNDNPVVAHPTNETTTRTDLESSDPDFLDRHSASICSTVDYHGYLRNAIASWNSEQCTIPVGTVLTRLLAHVVTKTVRQK